MSLCGRVQVTCKAAKLDVLKQNMTEEITESWA